ncbi:Transposon Ty3-I Gag-Pol polyprotein, partial [Linum perenne]
MAVRQPLSRAILAEPLPKGLVPPNLDRYVGTGDPDEHLQAFQIAMQMQQAGDAAYCRAFPATLGGRAREWYMNLPEGIITSWEGFARIFSQKYECKRARTVPLQALVSLRQKPNQSLKEFFDEWTGVVQSIKRVNHEIAAASLFQSTHNGRLRESLLQVAPKSLSDLETRVHKIILIEEQLAEPLRGAAKMEEKPGTGHKQAKGQPSEKRPYGKYRPEEQRRYQERGYPGEQRGYQERGYQEERANYTPLSESRKKILLYMQHKGHSINWPGPMFTPADQRSRQKFCDFHDSHGHTTEDCRELKNEIERWINEGRLKDFIVSSKRKNKSQEDDRRGQGESQDKKGDVFARLKEPMDNEDSKKKPRPEVNHVYQTIFGGESCPTKKVRKEETKEVMMIDQISRPTLGFSEEDMARVGGPSLEAMVIQVITHNSRVERVMVDEGSSADIILWELYKKMNLPASLLRQTKTTISGFSGHTVPIKGIATMAITIGDGDLQVTRSIDFHVMDCQSTYNMILGRPALAAFQAISSPMHQVLKFATNEGIGFAWGHPDIARRCYRAATKSTCLTISLEAENEGERVVPAESDVPIPLFDEDESKTVRVSSYLSDDKKQELVKLLREFSHLFAWLPSDMPGIAPDIIKHSLAIEPGSRPVQQKRWNICRERQQAVANEVEKLLKAGFIKEVQYPEWLANVVLVKKSSGAWRMCVDFTNLNDACPKDPYPLPNIEQLVDATANNEMLSFLDMFSGYHQIPLNKQDQEKTAFMTPTANYCYRVMPFGLKNAGATYQRMIDKVFVRQLGRNLEAYVDDLLVKSKKSEDHLGDLRETFNTLQEYSLRLNPAKCVFGATSGKFLGYLITRRGIEANPAQIVAITAMAPPKTVKEVQVLSGRLTAINQFIPRIADRCAPFFATLKNASKFAWTDKCNKAFEELKQFLITPPVLA